ncbi:MAG: AAA family ATPase, partial [Gammaproteobacteria bacterium]|nr:AAA family ATPase [Gammaproteobacteria bacterium]
MNEQTPNSELNIDVIHASISTLQNTINQVLIGQEKVVTQILIALLSNGHVLVEGVPGLGKTLLIRILSTCIDGTFKRIQFTPDLMPADITGHAFFDMKEATFRIRKGPIFTNFLLADEINRSPAKTQAALLEVMQDRQVTLDGETQAIPKPFMVLATQNPIEQEGTYP